LQLINAGQAYVCDLTPDETREYRGNLQEPGKNSPYRERSAAESLDLFERMRAGEFPDGTRTLKAKVDMAAPNLNLRDPVMYRIMHTHHHRTGDKWCIYPMYDYTHGQSDSIERITHSLCTLEFEDHRPLYNWYLEALGIYHPEQTEFARLNIDSTVLSKRRLIQLVEENHVSGWDDPRMPTICGMRRRGYTPESIRSFCDRISVTKRDNVIEMALLEHCLREDLNKHSRRVMAVQKPLKLVIQNYPEDLVEEMDAVNNPENESAGKRTVPFSRELYIEQDDFREEAPRKFFRLTPGREVRLRYGYFVTCTGFEKNEAGEVTEVHATYDPESRGGNSPDGRKVKSTIHWVSAKHALQVQVRLYNPLFTKINPDEVENPDDDYRSNLNPDSVEVIEACYIEPSVAGAKAGTRYQFERIGYFCVDADTTADKLVFNRTVPLRDAWKQLQKRQG
jgi:glutaminyl-tRNA synthetase